MKKVLLLLVLAMAGVSPLFSQNDAIQGHCDLGGTKALVSGLGSTNYNEGIIPGCTVSVYLTGTTTLASIYSNSTGTSLTNPFTAVQFPSPNAGYWIFYAASGQGYDVKLSGGNGNPSCTTAPNCYTTPLTYTDLKVGGGGGGSGVTSFSAGNLPPLFTTNVTNPGTTPNLAFNLSNAPANTLFGNFTGSSGPPFFATFTCTGLLTCTYDSGTNIWNVNIPSTSTLSITATSPIRVNGGTGPVSSGTANIDCPTCGTPNIRPVITPPLPGQYVIVYPDTVTTCSNAEPGRTPLFTCYASTNGAGTVTVSKQFLSSFPPADTIYTATHVALPAGLSPGNVTSVYAFAVTQSSGGAYVNKGCTGALNLTPSGGTQWSITQTTVATSLTGASFPSLSCTFEYSNSGSQPATTTIGVLAVGYIVYYTGTPIPQPTYLNIGPYLDYDITTNTLGTDPIFPWFLNGVPVASISGDASSYANRSVYVYDGANASDCSVGGGSFGVLCASNGSSWTAVGGGGLGINQLTGDVIAGPGSGSQAATISANAVTTSKINNSAVTLAKIQNAGANSVLLGSGAAGSGNPYTEIILGTNLSMSGTTLNAAGSGFPTGTTGGAAYYTGLAGGISTDVLIDQGSIPFQINATSTATQQNMTYSAGHAPAGAAGSAVIAPDTSGNLDVSENGAAFDRVCTHSNGQCTGGSGGGYTNVTGSVSETTVAQINTACGSGTYYATTPLSIATGGTITCTGAQFSKSGLWTIASGQTVTFSNLMTETDGPNQHFAGSGSVVLASGQIARPEWWGAVGDGTTDDHVAMQFCFNGTSYGANGGTCQLGAKSYNMGTTTVSLASSNVNMAGVSFDGAVSSLLNSSATANILNIGGVSSAARSNNVTYSNFKVARTTTPSGTATGINIAHVISWKMSNVLSADSMRDFAITDAPSNQGVVENSYAVWGFGSTGCPATAPSGWYLDGGSNGFLSLYLNNNGTNDNCTSTLLAKGMEITGALIDLFVDSFQTATTPYGIYAASATTGQDVRFRNSILDRCFADSVYFSGLDAKKVSFDGGWMTIADSTQTAGVELANSSGFAFSNIQFYISANHPAIYDHGSGARTTSITDNHFWFNGSVTGGQAISASSTSALNIVGNAVDGGGNTLSNPVFQFASVINSNVKSNLLTTASGTGISLDVSSSFVCCTNLNTLVTLTVSDSGSNNSFSTGVAWGGITGTLSSQTDLQTALNAKAPLASPALTGTPTAPTAVGGTNTTQLATTAFVQAAIAAAGTGSGIVTYSGPAVSFTGTLYFPIGGGGLSSTTETNVDVDSPAAVTIQNMTVQMSTAPGVGNSLTFTWRKNASSQTLTCTISGSSATSCSDTTHSFTTAALDLLDIQVVTTGTVVGTPTVVMAAQVGVSSTTSTAFSAISGGTNTGNALVVGNSSSLDTTGTGMINANKLGGIAVSGTPSTGNVLTATSSSAATWQAGGGAWTNITGVVTISGGSGSVANGAYTTTTTTATISISSIPSTYTHLKILVAGAVSSGSNNLICQFNGDTSAHYALQVISGINTSPTAGTAALSSSLDCLSVASSGGYGFSEATIPFYSQTIAEHIVKTSRAVQFGVLSVAGNVGDIQSSFWWQPSSSAAINSMTISAASTLTSGFSISIYGVN